jgi:hypothetical protein
VLGSVQPAKHLVSSSKQAGFLNGKCCKLTETVSEPVGRRKASAQTELLCEPELPESNRPFQFEFCKFSDPNRTIGLPFAGKGQNGLNKAGSVLVHSELNRTEL